MGLPDRWDTCSRTIFLEIQPTAFAHWENTIAVAIESNVVLLDSITGIRTSVLSGHVGVVLLEFSPDGTLLISVSYDWTVKLWDVQTGGVIGTFGDHVSTASISPDGTTIALGTNDGAIYLWNIRTWKCHSIETRQDSAVRAVRFSPIHGRRLISLSRDGTVRQWDADGHQIGNPYQEADGAKDLAYASDGTRFVSCGGRFATIRDSESGAVVVRLNAPDRASLSRCLFSPDGRLIACVADKTIYVWNITDSGSRLVGHLVGHSEVITFITFSSSLISGSLVDRSLKFWQSSSFLTNSMATDHTAELDGSTLIMSAKLFADVGTVVTSDSSGVVKTWDLMTGGCKSSFSTPAKGVCDTHLAGDTLYVVWCTGAWQCHAWDVYKGQLFWQFTSYAPDIKDLKISRDGSKIFRLCSERTSTDIGDVKGADFWVSVGPSCFVQGSKVEPTSSPHWGWDFQALQRRESADFKDRPRLDLVSSIKHEIHPRWIEDRPRLDLVSFIKHEIHPRWIEDTITKRLVFRLPQRCIKPDTEIEWDGRYLLIWSSSGGVVTMDFDPVCLISNSVSNPISKPS